MGKRRKLFGRIVRKGPDTNIPFEQARTLLQHLGFSERISGSHHVFVREGVEELITLQRTKGGKCKPYQVGQMREVLLKYNMGEEL